MRRWIPFCLLSALRLLPGATVQVRTTELPWAIVGTGYSSVIETGADARCDAGDVVVSLEDGVLPRGLEFRGESLVGTPQEGGIFHLSVRAANGCSSIVKSFDLVVTGKPILRTVPESIAFECQAGSANPAAQNVQIYATWPGLPYSARVDAAWLTEKARAGVTPEKNSGLNSDLVSLEVNAKDLAPGVYHTTVTFFTWMGANAPAVPVTLTVLP